MKHTYAATPCTISTQLQPPSDDGVVGWTLRDNAGVVLSTGTLALSVPSYAASLGVPASANGKLLPTETRFVTFTWTGTGTAATVTVPYLIVDFLPLRVQAADVRGVLGANVSEIADDDVDLVGAAAEVQADLPAGLFLTALTAGDLSTGYVNRMIAYKAALEFVTSLPLRVAESLGNDQAKFSRYRNVDLNAVMASLRSEYERLIGLVKNTPDADVVQPHIFTTSYPGVDTIRGPDQCLNFPPWSRYSRA